MWPKVLRGFALVWSLGVGGLIVLAVVARFLEAPSVWHALADVQAWFSPFNVLNWVVTALFLSPAIGAWWLAQKLG